MTPTILVIGSFVQDLTWRTQNFPSPGATVIGTFRTGPGGKGSNQAVAAGRAGAPVCFVGSVGKDAFGRDAKAFYASEGISAFWLEQSSATGTAGILVNAQGQNEIVVALGANAEFTASDLPDSLWEGIQWLVCQMEIHPRTVVDLFVEARRRGIRTVLNPAPMREDFPAELLKLTDYLLPNETEFMELYRLGHGIQVDLGSPSGGALPDGEELHRLCRNLGPEIVVVTLGSRGAFVSGHGEWWFEAAHTNLKVVDTTGAGDAFVGGFICALNETGANLAEAVRFASAVAALSVTRAGTAPAMPDRAVVDAFLKSGKT